MSLALRNVMGVARRELAFYFISPIAYVALTVFLVACGTYLFATVDFFELNRATIRPLIERVPVYLLFFAPALSMRLISEERRSGTIELLFTMPITDTQIVLGKYLAALLFLLLTLATTLVFPLIVAGLGPLDLGLVFAGYLGLFLIGSAFLALGLLTSTWTKNQIVALILAVVLCAFFYYVDDWLALLWEGAREGLAAVSFRAHFANIARGVLDTRDIVFYLSVITAALVAAVQSLQSRNWK